MHSMAQDTRVPVPRWVQLVALPLAVLFIWTILRAAGPVLLLFVIGALVALLLNPFVMVLRRIGLPRGIAVLLVMLSVIGVLVLAGLLVERLGIESGPLRWAASLDLGYVGFGVVGLFVLVLGLVARRHDVYLADPVPEVTVTTSPRSLARAVGHEVRSHSDVVSASVVASTKKITVKASTLDPAEAVREGVRARVDEMLVRLPLARRPRVSVSVTTTKGVK
jgi:hypothetical protein